MVFLALCVCMLVGALLAGFWPHHPHDLLDGPAGRLIENGEFCDHDDQ